MLELIICQKMFYKSSSFLETSRCLVTGALDILYAPQFCMFLFRARGKIIANWMGLFTGVWKWTLRRVVHDWQISSN